MSKIKELDDRLSSLASRVYELEQENARLKKEVGFFDRYVDMFERLFTEMETKQVEQRQAVADNLRAALQRSRENA